MTWLDLRAEIAATFATLATCIENRPGRRDFELIWFAAPKERDGWQESDVRQARAFFTGLAEASRHYGAAGLERRRQMKRATHEARRAAMTVAARDALNAYQRAQRAALTPAQRRARAEYQRSRRARLRGAT